MPLWFRPSLSAPVLPRPVLLGVLKFRSRRSIALIGVNRAVAPMGTVDSSLTAALVLPVQVNSADHVLPVLLIPVGLALRAVRTHAVPVLPELPTLAATAHPARHATVQHLVLPVSVLSS